VKGKANKRQNSNNALTVPNIWHTIAGALVWFTHKSMLQSYSVLHSVYMSGHLC